MFGCFVTIVWEESKKHSRLAVFIEEPETQKVAWAWHSPILIISCSLSQNTQLLEKSNIFSAVVRGYVPRFDQSTMGWFTDKLHHHVLQETGRLEAASKQGVREGKEMQHISDR